MFLFVEPFCFIFKGLITLPLLLTHWLILSGRRVLILETYVPYFMLSLSMRGTSGCCKSGLEAARSGHKHTIVAECELSYNLVSRVVLN